MENGSLELFVENIKSFILSFWVFLTVAWESFWDIVGPFLLQLNIYVSQWALWIGLNKMGIVFFVVIPLIVLWMMFLLCASVNSLENRLLEEEEVNRILEKDIDELEEEAEKLNEENEMLQDSNDDLKNRNDKLQTELIQIQKTVTDLHDQELLERMRLKAIVDYVLDERKADGFGGEKEESVDGLPEVSEYDESYSFSEREIDDLMKMFERMGLKVSVVRADQEDILDSVHESQNAVVKGLSELSDKVHETMDFVNDMAKNMPANDRAAILDGVNLMRKKLEEYSTHKNQTPAEMLIALNQMLSNTPMKAYILPKEFNENDNIKKMGFVEIKEYLDEALSDSGKKTVIVRDDFEDDDDIKKMSVGQIKEYLDEVLGDLEQKVVIVRDDFEEDDNIKKMSIREIKEHLDKVLADLEQKTFIIPDDLDENEVKEKIRELINEQ